MTTSPSPAQAGLRLEQALHEQRAFAAYTSPGAAVHPKAVAPYIERKERAAALLGHIDALSATVAELRAQLGRTETQLNVFRQALAEREASLKLMERRYSWLANRVLACDYGDNDKSGHVGWRIRADLLPPKYQTRAPAFMYGPSIDAAIDARLAMHYGATAPEALPPRGEGND
jgi:hypothetical protein